MWWGHESPRTARGKGGHQGSPQVDPFTDPAWQVRVGGGNPGMGEGSVTGRAANSVFLARNPIFTFFWLLKRINRDIFHITTKNVNRDKCAKSA